MTARRESLALLTLLLLMAAGCSIVDAKYYRALEDSGKSEPEPDGGAPDSAVDSGDDRPQLVERCGVDRFPLTAASTTLEVDTSSLANQVDRTSGLTCTDGQNPVGNEGFLAVNMRAGETWHFHVAAVRVGETPRNPSLYMLEGLGNSCDFRSCAVGADVCGDRSEHFTFTAPNEGVYYLGIDDRAEGGGNYVVEAFKNICGNGVVLHGEACDPKSPAAGEKCDSQCRIVLDSASSQESIKPHDDFSVANALEFPASQSLTIAGAIGGCERDYYTFAANAGARVRITVLDQDEQCKGTNRVQLQLQNLRNARVERVQDGTSGGKDCPSLTRDQLPEGRYYIRLQDSMLDQGQNSAVSYKLKVELNPP